LDIRRSTIRMMGNSSVSVIRIGSCISHNTSDL
jgi:hypothetical protein